MHSSSGRGFRFPSQGHSDPESSDLRNVIRNVPFWLLEDVSEKSSHIMGPRISNPVAPLGHAWAFGLLIMGNEDGSGSAWGHLRQ